MKLNLVFLTLLTSINAFGMGNKPAPDSTGNGYMVSVNEMQFLLTEGINKVMENPEIGSVTILDFSMFPPDKTNVFDVPCSVTGPPVGVAITPDNKLALVTSSMKIDPANPSAQVPDNRLTVIDLETKTVLKTLTTGVKPSGVSVSPDGKTAFVCNRDDGTVTALNIAGKEVTVSETFKIAEPQDSLSHIVISPDGSFGLASLNQADAVIKVLVDGDSLSGVVEKVKVGKGPYCLDITPDGQKAIVANVSGANITILDLQEDKIKVTDEIYTGPLPEGLDISPDGQWAVVSSMGYTLLSPEDSMRQEHAQLVLMKRNPEYYSIIQRVPIDRIPQAAVFSPDSKYVVAGSFESRRLKVYELNDGSLKDTGVVIPVPGQPCSLRVAQ